jgi:adenosylcobinamide-phosphate synthase
MLGYPQKPHGTASARLDDLTMWLPARLTAVALAAAGADPGALSRARGQSGRPPSPNSGWPMATLAALLSVRLEKPGVYVIDFGAPPTPADADRARALVARSGWLVVAAAGVVVWF